MRIQDTTGHTLNKSRQFSVGSDPVLFCTLVPTYRTCSECKHDSNSGVVEEAEAAHRP